MLPVCGTVTWTGGRLVSGAVLSALLAACVPTEPAPVSGRALYSEFCQVSHGAGGQGDGPLAKDLSKRPADLTRISERNGGEFPLIAVMSTIDGYTRKNDHGSIMPEMGLQFRGGRMARIDAGDGIETPVPESLLALAEYLRSLQRLSPAG